MISLTRSFSLVGLSSVIWVLPIMGFFLHAFSAETQDFFVIDNLLKKGKLIEIDKSDIMKNIGIRGVINDARILKIPAPGTFCRYDLDIISFGIDNINAEMRKFILFRCYNKSNRLISLFLEGRHIGVAPWNTSGEIADRCILRKFKVSTLSRDVFITVGRQGFILSNSGAHEPCGGPTF